MNHSAATRAARAARRMCRRLGQALRKWRENAGRALRTAVQPVPRLALAAALPDGRTICFADWGTVCPASPAGGQEGTVKEARVICPACKNAVSAKAPRCPLCLCRLNGPACSPRSRVAALMFCIFLGFFGAHRLYVGKILSGLSMFLITVTTLCGLYEIKTNQKIAIFMLIWVICDIVVICSGKFRDGRNRPLVLWI